MKKRNLILIFLVLVMTTMLLAACSKSDLESDSGETSGIISAEEWADKHPDIYASYLKNSEVANTTYGGSEPIDYLEKYPELKTFYAGYGFSKEYLRARGHVYAMEDVVNTARPKPGASCLSCKTADYLEMINEYGTDVHAMDFDEMAAKVVNTISCYDCHQNTPGEVTLTREYLTTGLDKLDTEFKMGDLACAQCHVEYYLDPGTKEVILPWDNGIDTDGIQKYYDDIDFHDWVHPDTGTKLLKAQHPEFETYQGSLHSKMGVSCMTCHMPNMENDKGDKYTSHQWTSPLKHVKQSCLACHKNDTEEELIAKVEEIQEKVENKTNEVSKILFNLVHELTMAVESGEYPEEVLEEVRAYHRKAQFKWDFVFVENSTGFHNPELTHKTLDEAREYAEKGLEVLGQFQ